MQCIGRTKERTRCARSARSHRLTCKQHGWQLLTLATTSIMFIAVVLGAINDWFGIMDRFTESHPPGTKEECIDSRMSGDDMRNLIVAEWFCSTEFANIWDRSMQMEIIDSNHELVMRRFDEIYRSPDLDPISRPEDAPDANEDGRLSRIFELWARYREREAVVVGRVLYVTLLQDDEISTDWVVQLGTVDDDSVVIYVRLVGEPGWEPPPDPDCKAALVTIIPIARGYVPRAGAAGNSDAIYAMASGFLCSPPI